MSIVFDTTAPAAAECIALFVNLPKEKLGDENANFFYSMDFFCGVKFLACLPPTLNLIERPCSSIEYTKVVSLHLHEQNECFMDGHMTPSIREV